MRRFRYSSARCLVAAALLLAALLALLLAPRPAGAASSAGAFEDLPAGHWSYDALNLLNADGFHTGYPYRGTGTGIDPFTRIEFALACDMVLEQMSSRFEKLRAGAARPERQQALARDLYVVRKLFSEFRSEIEIVDAGATQVLRRVEASAARLRKGPWPRKPRGRRR